MDKIQEFAAVAGDVAAERVRQDARWGEQNHRDGTGRPGDSGVANMLRDFCDDMFAANNGTWRDILAEETAEAFAERDPVRLRAELVQVAAVACSWIAAIDRRAR